MAKGQRPYRHRRPCGAVAGRSAVVARKGEHLPGVDPVRVADLVAVGIEDPDVLDPLAVAALGQGPERVPRLHRDRRQTAALGDGTGNINDAASVAMPYNSETVDRDSPSSVTYVSVKSPTVKVWLGPIITLLMVPATNITQP